MTVELQRHSPQQPLVQALRGELRIGKELNMFQEVLKEWYYTGFFVGTLSFASLYLAIWLFLLGMMERLGLRYWHGLEEPECELDMDFDLGGGFGADDNTGERDQTNHPQAEEQEPRFEDYQEDYQPPPHANRGIPHPPRDHASVSRENSEDEWENIYYSANNGAERS